MLCIEIKQKFQYSIAVCLTLLSSRMPSKGESARCDDRCLIAEAAGDEPIGCLD